ncbi:hypothetical protein TNCV_1012431 [Trichonephila clavipes]|uniref:Uncharacterized protein n=1 Tax=Trichonephila clavipes TaxID=2585209 RepID=A0A8X6VXF6_TRICX|nr:hypothetical protein TNCV_1012431 [Trichonephila clavipes]
MSDIGPFPGYFLDDKQYHSRARSVGVYNPMTDLTYSLLRIVRMPNPVQSNCDAHDTIANRQYGAVWSMGHTQQVCVRIVLLPSNVWQQFFGRSAFLRQQETDLPPAELWCACSFLLIGRYMSSAGVVLLTRPPPCRLLHIPEVLNDFHSRETTL